MEQRQLSARDTPLQSPGERHDYEPIGCEDLNNRAMVGGRTLEFLLRHELILGCNVEKDNIYGFAIAMPQIARSTGYSNLMTGLAIRAVLFLFVTFFLQGLFMYMMIKEQNIMIRYAGQMNLCDFGAFIERCTGDEPVPGCRGPAGTEYTPARLYSWPQWADRQFFKDSLLALFPDMHDDINAKVDPGEWGLEDYWCRLACCFTFVMMVMTELLDIFRVLKLLWVVPNLPESWVSYGGDLTPGYRPGLEDVHLQVAGIPAMWKVFNLIVLVLPRTLMFKLVCECGITFLMESAGITEVIVNAVALGFVLGIGDMIVTDFTTRASRDVMAHLQDYKKHLLEHEEDHEKKCNIEHVMNYEHSAKRRVKMNIQMIPVRLLGVCGLTLFLVSSYYHTRCIRDEHGHWISAPVYMPASVRSSVWSAMLPRLFPLETESEPFWQMPEP